MSFTSFAQIEIGAVWVHALRRRYNEIKLNVYSRTTNLETDGVDGLSANWVGCRLVGSWEGGEMNIPLQDAKWAKRGSLPRHWILKLSKGKRTCDRGTHEVVSWPCDFYERVPRVLFIRYAVTKCKSLNERVSVQPIPEARQAGVKIWAMKTFLEENKLRSSGEKDMGETCITITIDPGIAQVTNS